MTSRIDRLFRLEAGLRAASAQRNNMAREMSDYDGRVALIRDAGFMPSTRLPIEADQEQAWAIGREMLERWPGCAGLFAARDMQDYLV